MKPGYFIEWLTGFYGKALQALVDEKVIFGTFLNKATLNANTDLIKRVICGYRIAGIDSSLTKKVWYLDKLVDELANGRKLEKILRIQ